MKIGVYDPYLDDCGGGEKYMMTIASVLSDVHDVDVFWDERSDIDHISDRFGLDLSKIKLVKNIFTKKTSTFRRLLNSRKYDVLIILSDGSLPFVFSRKLFLHIQRPIDVKSYSLFEKIKKMRVTDFFCNSEFTKSFIDSQFRIHSKIIYPPVELHPLNTKKKNIILHVGRFRVFDKTNGTKDYKKQYVMVEAFKKMVDQGLKDWKFILAVSVQEKDREEFQDLERKAKGYPVQFEVNKSNRSLWKYYSEAKIYWHATGYGENLEESPEKAEHFGISTVEAMGAGAVPVVINAGGQPEIVKDGESGMLWKTIPELIEETLILISSNQLLTELSGKAKQRAQNFTLEMFKKNIFKLINS